MPGQTTHPEPPKPAPRTSEPARPPEHAVAPPPEPRPRVTLVTLRVESKPPGAVVRNGHGAVLGATPLSMSVKPGSTQNLTFTKHNYASVTRKLVIADANDKLVVDLSRLSARRSRRR